MAVNVKREVSISSPFTTADLYEFLTACEGMGVPSTAKLGLRVVKGGGDQRESWPDGCTITGKA